MTYEIVKNIGTEKRGNVTRESNLVKLDTPAICRASKTFDLYETDYVLVEALRILDDGVVYEETHVVASDETGTINDAILYLGSKALTVYEAMFAIGEHNFTDIEPDNDTETETDNGEAV